MKKKSLNRKVAKPKTWLVTGFLAAAAVAYVLFGFLPLQNSMNQLRQQVQERRQQIMQAQSLVGTVAQTLVRLAAAREVCQLWRSEAPRPAQIITHYASLTQQADEAGVSIDRLDPLPAVELNLIDRKSVV